MIFRSKIVYHLTGNPYRKHNHQGCGTDLKNLISWFPIAQKSNCRSCRSLEVKMNSWGPDKCREKMPYILAKLKIAAKRRGLPFSERLVKLLVEKAIDG